MGRALRIGAGVALAFLVLTCSHEQVAGPQPPGALRLDLSALTGPAASGEPDIPLDSIVIVFRPAGQSAIAYDTTITPVGSQVQGDSAVLALSVPLSQSPETFDVDVQAYGADVMWYRLTTTLTIVSGPNPTPAPFTARYVGTGANAGRIQVLPADTTAEGGAPFTLHSVVYDSSNTPLTGVPVGYRLSDSTRGVVNVNFLTATFVGATNVRDSVWLIAETPTHITDSTRVHIEPPATTLAKASGDLQSGPVGVPLPLPLSVEVRDALGAPYQKGRVITWSVTAGAANLSATTTTSDSAGNASVTVTPTGSGALSIQATSPGLSGSPATFTATVTSTAPNTIVKDSGDAQTDTVGLPLAQQLVVRVTDASANPVSGTQVTWSVVLGGGAPSLNTTLTDAAGRARVTFTLGQTVGPNSITATVAGLSPVTFNATGVAGQPASVAKISGDNQTGTGGAALAQPLVVEVRDGFANPVPTATVNWTTTDGGSFAPASGPSGIDGRAQTTWTLGPTAPSQTASVTVGALTPVTFSATASIGSPALSLSFAGVPGVGIGLSAKVYVDINQTAPVGGTAVTVASGNPSLFTVAPGNLTIPQGMTRDSVTISGVSSGQADLTASAAGYTSGTLPVVVQNRNISVPPNLNVPYGQTASLPVQLPAPAPTGGVTFSVVSSAPGNVSVASPTVTIPAGGQTANATLNGVLPGPATITVSNAAYLDGVTNAATTASLNIVQASATLNASFGASITINFESNGVGTAAPAPGISVSLTPSDLTCVAATSPVTIDLGLVNTTAMLTYGGSATLPCTTKVLAQATNLQPDSINVTVNPVPGISVGTLTVGSGLQDNTSFTLGAPNHGNINVTLTSSDPGVLLAPNATTAGTGQITIPVLDGVQTVGFYVQALEGRTTDTIRATVTVAAPGFSDGTATMTAQQAALDLQGLPTSTTTLSPSSFVYARVGTAGAGNGSLNQLQAVRAGAPGPLTVTFTTPANGIGELLKEATPAGVTQTATIPIGLSNTPTDTTSGGVAFHPLLSGTTSVSATIPGYIATTQATRAITATQPGITVGALTVGSGLQDNTSFTLGAPNHGNFNVTLTSSNPAVLLSPNATTAGTGQITIPVLDGVQTVGFYVQGLEGQTGSVTATVTVSAPGFTNGTASETVVQAALDLQGLPTATTPLTPSSFVYARVGTSAAGNGSLNQLQAVRAGAPGPLTVTFTTPANGIGELLKEATPAGVTQTATIPIGLSNTPTDTTTGGVAFHPLAGLGTTTVSATIPGYIATTQATRSIISSTPGISVGSLTVGSGLQDNTSFTLGAPNHGNFIVTLTSSDPAILLSPNATTAGQSQITIPVADGVQTVGFYVQGLEGRTSTVSGSITVSAPSFTDGAASETIVQAALDLQGVPATMAVGAADANIYVRVGTAAAGNGSLNQLQAVRAGLPGGFLSVSVTSSDVNAATLVNSAGATGSPQTVMILSGQSNSPTTVGTGGVAVRRVAAGISSISAAISGLITTGQGTRSVTVQ